MSIKAVIFDLDGTLADTIPLTLHSIGAVVKELTGRILTDEEILREFGISDIEIVKKFVTEEKKQEAGERYIRHFSENFHRYIKPIDGIKALLSYIRSKGIKTGIVTGRSLRVTRLILEKLGILQHFTTIVAGDQEVAAKPSPEGILKALGTLGAKPEESIFVGDFDVDIQAGHAAGVISVLALWSSTGSEELIALKPDAYFRSVYSFISWLEENAEVDEESLKKAADK